jgi:hypothetical protein
MNVSSVDGVKTAKPAEEILDGSCEQPIGRFVEATPEDTMKGMKSWGPILHDIEKHGEPSGRHIITFSFAGNFDEETLDSFRRNLDVESIAEEGVWHIAPIE